MSDFLEVLSGGNTKEQLLAYILLGLLGATIWLAINLNKGIKKNKHTPNKFDFWYFVADNWLRIFLTPIFVYLFALGGNSIEGVQEIVAQYPAIQLTYVGIGFFTDKIIAKYFKA